MEVLNSQQLKIKYAPINKNLCIIACAGSGKTTTILHRIEYLINTINVDPSSIIVTTFTVCAATDIIRKLKNLLHNNCNNMFVGTIDSLAYKILSDENFFKDQMYHVREFIHMLIEYLKTEESKKFTDKIKYIFIDEFQDINDLQYEFINLLYQRKIIVTVVGDDYQNIYTFRDSNIEYIINYEKYFENSQTYYLEVNYRSTPEIINIANKIIKNNLNQKVKNMIPHVGITRVKPTIINIKQWSKQYNFIIDTIQKNNNLSIAIISRKNWRLYEVDTYLNLYGIKSISSIL